MPRRALRPSFVVTFALGAAAMAGGCSSKDSGNGPGCPTCNPPALLPDGGTCPADVPMAGGSCDLQSSMTCDYPKCDGSLAYTAVCQGAWTVVVHACNPPFSDASSDVSDAGPDGEGQDGGHVADATGDVAPDAGTE